MSQIVGEWRGSARVPRGDGALRRSVGCLLRLTRESLGSLGAVLSGRGRQRGTVAGLHACDR